MYKAFAMTVCFVVLRVVSMMEIIREEMTGGGNTAAIQFVIRKSGERFRACIRIFKQDGMRCGHRIVLNIGDD